VLRLTSGLEPHQVRKLKDRFQDILLPGGDIRPSEPFAAEADEPGIERLARLVVDFDRKDFGKLRGLIDAVNDF
jgi:hypothetical protein